MFPTVVEVCERIAEEALFHVPPLAVVAVKNHQRLLLVGGYALKSMWQAARNGNVVAGFEQNLFALEVPVPGAGFDVEGFRLEEVVMRNRCHEAGCSVRPLVVPRADLLAKVF